MERYGKNKALSIYYKETADFPLLSREEELSLGKMIKEGNEEAIEKMVTSNLRLVVKIAYDFANTHSSIEDLICEGNIGLLTAARKYDYTMGTKFSTYAGYWIRAYIRRFIMEKNRTIRIPFNAISKIYKIEKAKNEFNSVNDRMPTNEEISNITGLSVAVIKKLIPCPLHFLSLEEQVQDESNNERGDVIADEVQIENLKNPQIYERNAILMEHIDTLSERDKIIITQRYGLDGKGSRILDETAKMIGRTRERVRQLQEKILKDLRKKLEKDGINGFNV